MHVLFVEPSFPYNQREFVRALKAVGARVTGIGEAPSDSLRPGLRDLLYGYEQVSSVVDVNALNDTVQRIQAREWVDRLEATIEAHILPAAKVREACSIPGTSTRTAFLCRDKPAMKEVLREGGVPCAQSTGSSDREEILDFAEQVGYPLILKPRDAAGAAGTTKVDNREQLESALNSYGVDHGHSIAVEEFIEGHEGFYDTLCVNGQPVHEFACHYYPNVLEAMRSRWISPQILTTNRINDPTYQEVKAMGQRVIDLLEIGTSATHMEWFFGPKGLKFSEIGCRPPGVGAWDLYCHANDMDLYRDWANAIVHGRIDQQASRNYSSALINLRPDKDGVIDHYEGLEAVRQRFGQHIIDEHLPAPGTKTQGVDAGYMANAWIRLKHPNYDDLRGILNAIGETLKVRAR